jgi:4-amino-4-deoxy-L-arabinose transferase-like glycosyltransferase
LTRAWALGLVLVTSAWVRLVGLDLGWFMVDQARDVEEALRIARGEHFPLVGPVAPGLYALGPLYYYLLALPFWVRPEPEAAVLLLALLNLFTVYVTYRIGTEFFSSTVGLVAAALYGVFPMAVISARVLWNPGLVPVFSVTFFYALFRYLIGGRAWGLPLSLLALACLLQVHPSGLALGLVFVLALVLIRPRIPRREALAGVGLAVAVLAPYLLFEARRGFQVVPDTLRFLRMQGHTVVNESWLQIVWRAVQTPFALPSDIAAGFVASSPLGLVTSVQAVELWLFVAGAVWVFLDALTHWWRTGSFPRARGLLLLWIAVPLLTLTHKKEALFWYYFDLLYPTQFLAIGLLAERVLQTLSSAGCRVRLTRVATVAAAVVIGLVVACQVRFLHQLDREVLASGLFRLPTSVALRSPDPRWAIKERGYLDLMPLRYKRGVTEALLAEAPMREPHFFHRVHGAPFESLIEDNGALYRLLRPSGTAGGPAPAAETPLPGDWLVLQQRHWPTAHLPIRRQVGPYSIVRSPSPTGVDRWRCSAAAPAGWTNRGYPDDLWPLVGLPARAIPDSSIYAVPPLTAWPGLPLACRGSLRGRADPVSLVVSLRTAPLPDHRVTLGTFTLDGDPLAPSRSLTSLTAIHRYLEVVFDVAPSPAQAPRVVAFELLGTVPVFDLDVYEVPGRGSPP